MPLSLTSRRNQICIFFAALDFVFISDASGFKILYIPFISVYNPFPKNLTPGLETMVSYVDFRISRGTDHWILHHGFAIEHMS